jgi:hypothetical protein
MIKAATQALASSSCMAYARAWVAALIKSMPHDDLMPWGIDLIKAATHTLAYAMHEEDAETSQG